MLAIGIDPGTAICGFGLVEMVGNKLTPIHYGAVFTDKDMLPDEIYGGRELYHSLLCSRSNHERTGKKTGAR